MSISSTTRRLVLVFLSILILTAAWGIRPAAAYGYDDTLDGAYVVNGVRPDGSKYTGTLSVVSLGADPYDNETYSLTWTIDQKQIIGLGIYHDDLLSAAYGSQGCGLVSYTLDEDGELDGTWGDVASQSFGTELITSEQGVTLGALPGQYSVEGADANEDEYSTTLSIQGQGLVYTLDWSSTSNESQTHGVGLLEWNGLSAAYGKASDQCSIISYSVTDNYELLGVWATTTNGALGSEVASYVDADTTSSAE